MYLCNTYKLTSNKNSFYKIANKRQLFTMDETNTTDNCRKFLQKIMVFQSNAILKLFLSICF